MKRFLFFVCLLTFCGTGLHAQKGKDKDAKMFMNGPAHQGTYKNSAAGHFDQVKWKFKTGGRVNSSPVIDNGVAYIGSEDGNLYAIDTKTGTEKWRFSTGGAVHSTPAIFKGLIYFLSFDGRFYAVDQKTGKEKWHFKTGGEKWIGGYKLWFYGMEDVYKEDLFQYFLSSPVVNTSDNLPYVYFGSSDSSFYALDRNNGSLIWEKKTDGAIHTSAALHNNVLFFGSWDRKIYAVDGKSGEEKWQYTTRDDQGWGLLKGIQGSPTVYQGKVYCGSRDGYLYALNEENGKLVWEYSTGGTWIINTPAAHRGTIYAGTSDGFKFLALDAHTGVEKYSFKTGGYIYSSPAIAGNTAFFGSYTGKVYALDLLSQGKRWSEFQTEGSKEFSPLYLNEAGETSFGMFPEAYEGDNYYRGDKLILEKWAKLGPIVSSPAVADEVAYFGSGDGNLYAVNLTKNKSPLAFIISPHRNKEYLTGSDISIRSLVKDKDGVSNIEFYANNAKIGESDHESFVWEDVPAGKYTLKVKATDSKGGKSYSDTLSVFVKDNISGVALLPSEEIQDLVKTFVFPNPFVNETSIQFTLRTAGITKVALYNNNGLVQVLLNEYLEAGAHTVAVPEMVLTNGLYFVKVENGKAKKVLRIVKE